MTKSELLFHIFGLLFPSRCPACQKITQQRSCLCSDCENQVERIAEPCFGCGNSVKSCSCSYEGLDLTLASPFVYSGKIGEAIRRFKFLNERNLGEFFGKACAKCVKENFADVQFDCVTCVPQTKRKFRQRGYNQSELIAASCADFLGLPCYPDMLIKQRETEDQHNIRNAKDRRSNVKNAFITNSNHPVKGKTVLLCDDIKTTGATLYECKKTLLKAGAAKVCCTTAAVREKEIRTEPF